MRLSQPAKKTQCLGCSHALACPVDLVVALQLKAETRGGGGLNETRERGAVLAARKDELLGCVAVSELSGGALLPCLAPPARRFFSLALRKTFIFGQIAEPSLFTVRPSFWTLLRPPLHFDEIQSRRLRICDCFLSGVCIFLRRVWLLLCRHSLRHPPRGCRVSVIVGCFR